MIDPLEPKTRLVTCVVSNPISVGYSGFGSFLVPDDITLRRVVFQTDLNGQMDMILSTDQDFGAVGALENHEELQLYSGTDPQKLTSQIEFEMVFPLLKNSRLFYGFGPNAVGAQLILLFFT